jgi:hypothetical protein
MFSFLYNCNGLTVKSEDLSPSHGFTISIFVTCYTILRTCVILKVNLILKHGQDWEQASDARTWHIWRVLRNQKFVFVWTVVSHFQQVMYSFKYVMKQLVFIYRVIQKEVYNLKKLFYKYYWTYGDVLYIDWRENSQSYFHTLQALDVSPTCDAADVKSIIQLFPHSSQHVTGNSSHSLGDAQLQIIDIRTFRDFLSIRTQNME